MIRAVMRSRPLIALAATFLIAVTLVSCRSGGGASSADVIAAAGAPGEYGVGATTIDLVDTSRPTAANGDLPATSERKLTTEVWYPADPASQQPEARDVAVADDGAPYPLIVLAHGLSATRGLYASYGRYLASHGYVVAAPDFPSSNLTTPGGPRLNAVLEQPKDVSFIIDSVLSFNDDSGHLLEGAIDPDAIGMTGHSLGALTTMMVVYGTDRDARIKAALPVSTVGCFLPDGYAGDVSVPVLALGGTNDLITPPVSADRGYSVANAPRYLVHVVGADHTRFADVDVTDVALQGGGGVEAVIGGTFISDAIETAQALGGAATQCLTSDEARDPPISGEQQRQALHTIAVAFFDGYLKGDKASTKALSSLADLLPGTTVQADP
jgi:predicted dienelactone hydrolase